MKEIQLSQGKVALVDDSDFEYLNHHKWYAHKGHNTFYARRHAPRVNGKQHTILMHQVIVGNGSESVDHIDGDGLNNQSHNLRIATHQQNMHNTGKQHNNSSGFKGVTWNKDCKKWQAQIQANGKHHYLGLFATAEEAAEVWNTAARAWHGEFARTNFPQEG